jgi:hypothetical protein
VIAKPEPPLINPETVSVQFEQDWLQLLDKGRMLSFQKSPCQALMNMARDHGIPFQTTTCSYGNPFLVHATQIKTFVAVLKTDYPALAANITAMMEILASEETRERLLCKV